MESRAGLTKLVKRVHLRAKAKMALPISRVKQFEVVELAAVAKEELLRATLVLLLTNSSLCIPMMMKRRGWILPISTIFLQTMNRSIWEVEEEIGVMGEDLVRAREE